MINLKLIKLRLSILILVEDEVDEVDAASIAPEKKMDNIVNKDIKTAIVKKTNVPKGHRSII